MRLSLLSCSVVAGLAAACSAQVVHDYENLVEGFQGETFHHDGITYRDVNQVSGVYPDMMPFGPGEPGSENIIEEAVYWFDSFPNYGSRENVLTFGRAFINGPNLSLGALASVWMDLDEPASGVTLDLGYYENGPWGGIEYILEAFSGGASVGRDSFIISDLGGRDNAAWREMRIEGVEFDQLHIYAQLGGQYTVPRGIIDDLTLFSLTSCYADCDGNETLDVFDFLCFQDAFVAMDPYADCDGNTTFDVFDFLCFQDAFVTGCP
jgi:hypothetical protein